MTYSLTSLVNMLYWFFRIGFWLQAVYLLYITFALSYNPKTGAPEYTVFGEFRLLSNEWSSFSAYSEKEPGRVKPYIHQMPYAKGSFRYEDLRNAPAEAWVCSLIDLAHYLLWLSFTFQLFRIFSSLRKKKVFETSSIYRLRWIALVIGISPVLVILKNLYFADVVREHLIIPGYHVSLSYSYEVFKSICIMLLIFVLIEIFRYGLQLKQENDLTV